MRWRIGGASLTGTLTVPGDKSIAHRALMVGALAAGTSTIDALPNGEDVLSTARCLRSLGVDIRVQNSHAEVLSSGVLQAPASHLDAGNSGTTMRLLAGICAGQPFQSCLTGDGSLLERPMQRIAEPLLAMGAEVHTTRDRAPLVIRGGRLHGIQYRLPVASAQVKSCVLLAGLFASGPTTVVEPYPTRDHTERQLQACGVDVERQEDRVRLNGPATPLPFKTRIPGDFSTAAFFLVGALLTGGAVTVPECGTNPTRAHLLGVIERMGARVAVHAERQMGGEPVADVSVSAGELRSISIAADEVPLLVDELPLIALIATQAAGVSVIRGARELRYKECDRIRAVTEGLGSMGARIEERDDGWVVTGPTTLRGTVVSSSRDHRMAMMLAVAGSAARGETVVEGAEAASVSFPDFVRAFQSLGGELYRD